MKDGTWKSNVFAGMTCMLYLGKISPRLAARHPCLSAEGQDFRQVHSSFTNIGCDSVMMDGYEYDCMTPVDLQNRTRHSRIR